MLKVLLIDTSHHPLMEEDQAELSEEIAAADVVIHTFSPYKAELLKGNAEVVDIRQRFVGTTPTRFERYEKIPANGAN